MFVTGRRAQGGEARKENLLELKVESRPPRDAAPRAMADARCINHHAMVHAIQYLREGERGFRDPSSVPR